MVLAVVVALVLVFAVQLHTLGKVNRLMSTSNQGLQDLQAISDQFAAFSQTVVAALTTLEQELAALQGAPEVTDAQLEAFAQTFASAKAAITAALPATPAPPASQIKSAS